MISTSETNSTLSPTPPPSNKGRGRLSFSAWVSLVRMYDFIQALAREQGRKEVWEGEMREVATGLRMSYELAHSWKLRGEKRGYWRRESTAPNQVRIRLRKRPEIFDGPLLDAPLSELEEAVEYKRTFNSMTEQSELASGIEYARDVLSTKEGETE